MPNAIPDGNNKPTITGVDASTFSTPTIPAVNETTHGLYTHILDGNGNEIVSFGGGTEYTEGGTPPANPIGKVLIFDNGSSAWQDVDSTHGLPVDIKASVGLTVDLGSNNDVTLATLPDTSGGDLASMSANLGTIDTDTGNIATNTSNSATSLAIMDDWDNGASDGASVSGDTAHDTADAGEPVKIGTKAYSPDGTTPGTAVSEGDRTDAKGDLDGRIYTNDEHPHWWSYHSDGSTALTDASVQGAPGAGFQIVITDIIFSNGAATAINMFLEESTTKILGPIYLEAINGRGFVWKGKKHITANTAVTVTTSSSTAHSVDIMGYIQKV